MRTVEGESAEMRAGKFARTVGERIVPRYPVDDHQGERSNGVGSNGLMPTAELPVIRIDPRMKPFFESLVELGKVAEAALQRLAG